MLQLKNHEDAVLLSQHFEDDEARCLITVLKLRFECRRNAEQATRAFLAISGTYKPEEGLETEVVTKYDALEEGTRNAVYEAVMRALQDGYNT